MEITKIKFNWSILPVILSLLILLILISDMSFNIIELKNQKHFVIRSIIYALILSPIFFIQFSDYWKKQELHKKILILTISFLLLAVNFRFQIAFQFSIILALSSIYYLYKERKIYKPNTFALLTIIYFIINAASLLWSSNASEGVKYLLMLTPLLFISIIFSFFRISKTDFELIAILIVRFASLYIFLSISSWIIQSRYLSFPLSDALSFSKYFVEGTPSYDIVFAWSNHMHPTYNAIIILFALSICWYFLSKNELKTKTSIIELLFIAVGALIMSSITGSRYMQLSWVLVNTAGILLVLRRNRKLYAIGASVVLILSIVTTFVLSKKIIQFFDDPVRECHYNAAEAGIIENTWHGTGLGGMTKYINIDHPAYEPMGYNSSSIFPHIQPHNQIIGDLMQTGVFGLLTILLIIITLSVYGFKHKNWILMVFTILFIILANIEMPLMYRSGIFIYAVYLNFITSSITHRKHYELKKTTV